MSTDPRQFWTIAEWCADAAAHARRQAISECADLCDGVADTRVNDGQRDVAAELVSMGRRIRALLTRPEEARGGDGEKA